MDTSRVNILAPFSEPLDSDGLDDSSEAEEESKLSSVRDELYRLSKWFVKQSCRE